ncbi:hypothetical protein C922_03929 [Plasmodium inui San Antonio 1]|uniref:Uncharacterized protein n=1 Tax=Plasmodium inui San Antonio 1 TaxID=1237626 RepID=W7AK22_9APIC|nr:hypothetical protein C922_03929 [Plasmodium inui San Antonio 1]EUD65681.1 hypothetical protein C922_03929 [Plasmodium inui San Antonio 1]
MSPLWSGYTHVIENTACDSVQETGHDPRYDTYEAYNSQFVCGVREDIFPYESLSNIEEDRAHNDRSHRNDRNDGSHRNDHTDKTGTKKLINEHQMAMEKDLIFQNEVLRNVLKSSQHVKDMQRELFYVDARDFVPVIPPAQEQKEYSLRRDYPHRGDEAGDKTGDHIEGNRDCHYGGQMVIQHGGDRQTADRGKPSGKGIKSPLASKTNMGPPRIGEIKVNIDDIKKGLLTYYSNIYSLDHYDIEERINILKYGEKNISEHVQANYCYKKRELAQRPPFLHYNDELDNPNSLTYQSMFPDYYYKEGAGRSRDGKERFHLGSTLLDDQNKMEETNAFHSEYDHVGQISELLSSLKNKCADANFKAQSLTCQFDRKYDNPDNRFWVHNLVPMHLRKPALHNQDGIRNHLVTTYSQLYNEAMLNKKKIAALEKKLHILKLRANFPRGGYRMETRNAL